MGTEGAAKKLTVYVDETDRFEGRPVYELLMNLLYTNKIAGVGAFRGVAGYGSDRVFHTAKMLELSTTLPIKVEAVDAAEMIESVLPEVCRIAGKGLVEVSDTTVVKCSTKDHAP
jgi:hypothetical protein